MNIESAELSYMFDNYTSLVRLYDNLLDDKILLKFYNLGIIIEPTIKKYHTGISYHSYVKYDAWDFEPIGRVSAKNLDMLLMKINDILKIYFDNCKI